MVEDASTLQFVVECFWPGVDETDVRAVDARAARSTAELSAAGEPVRYLGSLLMREDETVFCLFHGPEQTVRRAAERAEIPFERILEATRSSWPITEIP
jgi:Nickel responsive protein SCO4226-like